jgi:hypothetical protein
MKIKIKTMNKKAQFEIARKSIYWMIAGFMIVIIILAFAIQIAGYRSKLTRVPLEMKAEFVSMRFTNIPECLAYMDSDTGRVYPGIIEIGKFTNEQINKCYLTEEEKGYKDINFGLWLKNKNLKIRTNNYYNKDDLTLIKTVFVKDGDSFTKDQLFIYVQERIGEPPKK